MSRPRQRDLTFYLVKEGIIDFDRVLPPQAGVTLFDVSDSDLPFAGRLAVKTPRSRPTWWGEWLRSSFPDIGSLRNMTNQAAMLLQAPSGRLFVVTFSYGRNLMELDAFERDFGLRVALNVVDPDSLKSVDARSFEQLTVSTRSQTSRATSLESFRMNRAEDIMKGVTGKPRDPGLAVRITGADAARLLYVPDLETLHEKCDALLDAHRLDVYKERYGFIDNLRAVRDPLVIAALNDEMIARFCAGDTGTMHMAPPDITDIEDIEHFVFGHNRQGRMQDLDLDVYRQEVLTRGLEVSLETLKRAKIGVIYSGTEEVHLLWSAYDCLVAEIHDGSHLHVLSGGTWYRIEAGFASQVARAVGERSRAPEFLPLRRPLEREPAYNERAASSAGLHSLDGCLARPAGAVSPLELCDLLGEDQRLVHVKRRSRSSTLSHLFAQGVLAGELFSREASFRSDLATKLADRGQHGAAALIPAGRPVTHEWEVVFAVLGDKRDGERDDLPFFSQLNFKIAAERLENLSYRVSLRQIPTDDDVVDTVA